MLDHRRRLRFGLDQKKWKELTAELKDRNNTLTTLLGFSEKLAPIRARKVAEPPFSWKLARERASSLFNALASSWECDCASPHYANLQLQSLSTQLLDNYNSSQNLDVDFAIWFAFEMETDIMTGTKPWGWHHVEVYTIGNSSPLEIDVSNPQGIITPNEGELSTMRDYGPASKRRKLLKAPQR